MHFEADSCLSQNFTLDQLSDIQVHETMVAAQFARDLFSKSFTLGSWTDMNDAWLESRVNLRQCIVEASLRVDFSEVRIILQIRYQIL